MADSDIIVSLHIVIPFISMDFPDKTIHWHGLDNSPTTLIVDWPIFTPGNQQINTHKKYICEYIKIVKLELGSDQIVLT